MVAADGTIVITDETVWSPDDLWLRVIEAGPAAKRITIDDRSWGRIRPVSPGTLSDGAVIILERVARHDEPLDLKVPSDRLTTIERAERDVILAALDRHAGNKSRAAEETGLSRRTLYTKLDRYRIRS